MDVKAANQILRSFRQGGAGLQLILNGCSEWGAFLRVKVADELLYSVFLCGPREADSHRTEWHTSLEAILAEAKDWLRSAIGPIGEIQPSNEDLALLQKLQDWCATGQYRTALRARPAHWR